MKPEIKCRRAVVNLNLQEIQALNDYRMAYGRRGFKCARSAMEKVIEAWKVAGAENATTTKKSLAVGNVAKLREALLEVVRRLEPIVKYMHPNKEEHIGLTTVFAACEPIYKIANAALAAPARQCDVGTADEQTDRFKDLCRKYRRGPGPRANCKGCPIQHESLHVGCTFAWSQTPYEESGVRQ